MPRGKRKYWCEADAQQALTEIEGSGEADVAFERRTGVEPIVPKREPPIVDGAAGYWQKRRRPLAARACSDCARRDRDPALWLDRFHS